MEHDPWIYVVLSSAAASALTWGVCRWWFGRQLSAAAERNLKLDRVRLTLGQQVMQARKQIEKLQQDSAATQRRPPTDFAEPPNRAAQLRAVLRSVENLPERNPVPAHGFADTQAMDPAP